MPAVAATEAIAFVAFFRDAAASGVMNWRLLPTPKGPQPPRSSDTMQLLKAKTQLI